MTEKLRSVCFWAHLAAGLIAGVIIPIMSIDVPSSAGV